MCCGSRLPPNAWSLGSSAQHSLWRELRRKPRERLMLQRSMRARMTYVGCRPRSEHARKRSEGFEKHLWSGPHRMPTRTSCRRWSFLRRRSPVIPLMLVNLSIHHVTLVMCAAKFRTVRPAPAMLVLHVMHAKTMGQTVQETTCAMHSLSVVRRAHEMLVPMVTQGCGSSQASSAMPPRGRPRRPIVCAHGGHLLWAQRKVRCDRPMETEGQCRVPQWRRRGHHRAVRHPLREVNNDRA